MYFAKYGKAMQSSTDHKIFAMITKNPTQSSEPSNAEEVKIYEMIDERDNQEEQPSLEQHSPESRERSQHRSRERSRSRSHSYEHRKKKKKHRRHRERDYHEEETSPQLASPVHTSGLNTETPIAPEPLLHSPLPTVHENETKVNIESKSPEHYRGSPQVVGEEYRKRLGLLELQKLETQQGVTLTKHFDMNSSCEEIWFEITHQNNNMEGRNAVLMMQNGLRALLVLLEMGNQKLGSYLELEGLSQDVSRDMKQYEHLFYQIYEQYWRKSSANPIAQIAMLLCGAILMKHFKNRLGSGGGIGNLFGGLSSQKRPSRKRKLSSSSEDTDSDSRKRKKRRQLPDI